MTTNTLREVTKEEFFRGIGPQNVHPRLEGPYPYTAYWEAPSRELRGKTVDYYPPGSALEATRYYLPE